MLVKEYKCVAHIAFIALVLLSLQFHEQLLPSIHQLVEHAAFELYTLWVINRNGRRDASFTIWTHEMADLLFAEDLDALFKVVDLVFQVSHFTVVCRHMNRLMNSSQHFVQIA